MQSEKDSDGRVYVWVDDDSPEIKPRPRGEPTALIFEMKEHIALLEAGAGQGALRIGRTDASSWPLPAGGSGIRLVPRQTTEDPPQLPRWSRRGQKRGASVQYRRPLARTRFRYRPSRDVSDSSFSLSNLMSYSRRL
jgi:hypothetical protein